MTQQQNPPDIPLLTKSAPLDYEVSDLIGEGASDFLVLCLDGIQLESFGTPHDTPAARVEQQRFVDALNDRSPDSLWPVFFHNWKSAICKDLGLPPDTTAESCRPVVSLAVSRVCAGYSKYLHAAIGLFKTLGDKINAWSVSAAGERAFVRIVSADGTVFTENGQNMALVIVLAVKRVLLAQQKAS